MGLIILLSTCIAGCAQTISSVLGEKLLFWKNLLLILGFLFLGFSRKKISKDSLTTRFKYGPDMCFHRQILFSHLLVLIDYHFKPMWLYKYHINIYSHFSLNFRLVRTWHICTFIHHCPSRIWQEVWTLNSEYKWMWGFHLTSYLCLLQIRGVQI